MRLAADGATTETSIMPDQTVAVQATARRHHSPYLVRGAGAYVNEVKIVWPLRSGFGAVAATCCHM